MMNEIIATYLGRTKFLQTWNLQKLIFSLVEKGKLENVILLNEHENVYTIGKSGKEVHLLANQAELISKGIEFYNIDRGGDITYHGPGQLVGYPILNLKNFYYDVHKYLRDLEETIILTLRDFGIEARNDQNFTGVWVKNDKIAAIGIKVSRWVTMHGFALNVNTDLSYFERIIPCGIFHKGITSINSILSREIDMKTVFESFLKNFEKIFNCRIQYLSNTDFFKIINELNIEEDKWLQVKQ